MRNLILLTGQFPFGNGEPFLENEINFLAASFDKIFIIANCPDKPSKRSVPDNCVVSTYNQKTGKFLSLLNLSAREVRRELRLVKKNYGQKIDATIFKTALRSFAEAKLFSACLSSFIKEHQLAAGNLCVYSYWLNDLALGACMLRSKFPKATLLSRAHGWDVYFERHPSNYLPFRTFLSEHLDALFFISQDGLYYFDKKTKSAFTRKLFLSRLGTVNTNKPELKTDQLEFNLISCSAMISLKRIHLIIEALSLLPDDVKITWFHVGTGGLENELKNLAGKKLTEKRNIRFVFTGQMSNKDLLRFYKENPMSLFVNVSEYEGLPVSMMEAMSFGIPVIATDVGGVKEIVQHQKNGILLNAHCSPDEIARNILFFKNLSQEKMIEFRMNAYETWSSRFNAEKVFPEFIDQILKLNENA